MEQMKRISAYWSGYQNAYLCKRQIRIEGTWKWVSTEKRYFHTKEELERYLEDIGYKVKGMKQTLYRFADDNYAFWRVVFANKRVDMIIRVPEGQAPLVEIARLQREREKLYSQGAIQDRLQDPIGSIVPAEEELIRKWLVKFGESKSFLGKKLEDNGEGKMVERDYPIAVQMGVPFG